MTTDSDLLVVCGVQDLNDPEGTVAIPIHKDLAARSAGFFKQFSKFESKDGCNEIVIDTFRPKTMLNYFRSIYDENIRVSARNCVELYCLARFLKDNKLETVVADNIHAYIKKSMLSAFDCFGLLFMTDVFDQTVYGHIKEQKTLQFAKSSFVMPRNDKQIRKAIKRNLMKAQEPIAKMALDKMVTFVSTVGTHVEVECLYYVTKMWLRGECNYENVEKVLVAGCQLSSTIRSKWKLYKCVVEWVRHHTPEKADENSVNAFNVIFKHEDDVEKVEDLDKIVDESCSSPDNSRDIMQTPNRAKRLVKKLSRALSQIQVSRDPRNSTVRRDIGEIRRFDDVIGKQNEADNSSVISDDPFGGEKTKQEVPETRAPKAALEARGVDDSGNASASVPSGEIYQIRFSVQRAGGLIGQGGSNIKELKGCSEAMVELDGPRNSRDLIAKLKDPGQKNKIQKLFSIEGDKVECFKVIDKMIEFLDYNGNVRLNLLVEGHLCGSLIGKGGCIIKEMKEESECRIDIDKEPYEGSSEKQIRLSGESGNVNPLLRKILAKLVKAKERVKEAPPSNPWFPTVPVEWLEGYESENSGSDSDSDSGSDSDTPKKRPASDAGDSPAIKKQKSDDGDAFF